MVVVVVVAVAVLDRHYGSSCHGARREEHDGAEENQHAAGDADRVLRPELVAGGEYPRGLQEVGVAAGEDGGVGDGGIRRRSVPVLGSGMGDGGARGREGEAALRRFLPFGGGIAVAMGRETGGAAPPPPLWPGRRCSGERRKRAARVLRALRALALALGPRVVELRPAAAGACEHSPGRERPAGSRA
jgi:hypothetical protein